MFSFIARRLGLLIPTFFGITLADVRVDSHDPWRPRRSDDGRTRRRPRDARSGNGTPWPEQAAVCPIPGLRRQAAPTATSASPCVRVTACGPNSPPLFPATLELSIGRPVVRRHPGPAGRGDRGTQARIPVRPRGDGHLPGGIFDADLLVGPDPDHVLLGKPGLDPGVRADRPALRHSSRAPASC